MTDATGVAKTQPQAGKFTTGIVIGLIVGSVAGCVFGSITASPKAASADSTHVAETAAPSADATPAPPVAPAHSWTSREGGEYAYVGSLSEDDQKAGKAAADVLMFRFLGEKGGVYTVESVANGISTTASCEDPCTIIRAVTHTPFGQSVQHVTFNPDSIVGSVLTDAFNGQLEVYRKAPQRTADEE